MRLPRNPRNSPEPAFSEAAPGSDMAIMDGNSDTDRDLMRLWSLVVELSEQISRTRQLAGSLHSESIKLKAQALHAETGFVFRRFNTHLSKDEYEAELERMNMAVSNENQSLMYDNKQLNSLLKEYEQTLESVMTTFRGRAHDVQEHELNLMKQYESMLMASETTALSAQLATDSSLSVLIAQCSRLLRMVLRLMGGEDPQPIATPPDDDDVNISRNIVELPETFDWAQERECELARLEKENEELRMLLKAGELAESSTLPLALPKVPLATIKSLMPRRPRMRGHSSFSSESSSGEFRSVQRSEALQELRDMSDETEVL